MENTRRAKHVLVGLLAVTTLYLLPEGALMGAKKVLEATVVIQLCHEVFKRQN